MKRFILFSSLLMLVFVSCTREGPPGPAGPQGPRGNDGGSRGDVFSTTVTLQDADWDFSSPSYVAKINWPELTPDIIDFGAVLVYWEINANEYTQLPVTFYNSEEFSTTLEFFKTDELITLWWTDSDLNEPEENPGEQTFKIVAIENTDLLAAKTSIDWSNYHEVREYLELAN